MSSSALRHDWTGDEVVALFDLPFNDLLYRAHRVHRAHHDPNAVQLSTLLSIKTGGCPEDCGYCSQAARYHTGVKAQKLMPVEEVIAKAKAARAAGATRFCMGAAWRGPKDRDLTHVVEMIAAVKKLGLETCATLGMLTDAQARTLKQAGLDYYSHNLDTAPEYYGQIVQTHTQQDRLDTIERVRQAGMKTCVGGIIGMGETREQRAGLLTTLANLPEHPQSVPINHLVEVPGTPLEGSGPLDPFEFVRTIGVARILMPSSRVRLAAGRMKLDDAMQALCFFAGASSIFCGDKLLTTGNPDTEHDHTLLRRLGLYPMEAMEQTASSHADILPTQAADGGQGSSCGAAA